MKAEGCDLVPNTDTDYDRTAMDLAGELVELPPTQRDARLEEICAGDASLRARVITLLRELSSGSTRRTPEDLTPSWFVQTAQRARVEQIGPYRLLRRVGVGGMSEVYEAEQDKPRRRVALKLIHPLRTTPAMLRRFEFEVEVLGRLEHPGVARVYDAGTAQTDFGAQPYFAMELVRGHRLDHWVRLRKPQLKRRLEILIDICDAVQHAHQHGVIHRDLKPANILVTEDGQVKVLDFGVAAAVEGASGTPAGGTMHTATGQIIGTLQYMSPEQASGDVRALDTRSDVYALGVIAYELLADRLPYHVSDKPLSEAVRVIRDEQPTRLSTINKDLRGDVETIVFKALDKEKDRRYASSAELAADVRRYLDYEPITARRPSLSYQLGKFARRHKVVVASALVVMFVLLGAMVATTVGLVQARRARDEAARQRTEALASADTAQRLYEFYSHMFESADPETGPGAQTTVRDLLDLAAQRVGKDYAGAPATEAAIRTSLAKAYLAVERFDSGLEHARAAVALLEHRRHGESGPSSNDSLWFNAQVVLGHALEDSGQFQAAEEHNRALLRTLTGSDRRARERRVTVLNELAMNLQVMNRHDECGEALRGAFDELVALYGPDAAESLSMALNRAENLLRRDRLVESEELSRRVLDRASDVLGPTNPTTRAARRAVASVLVQQARHAEAQPLIRQNLADDEAMFGKDHTTVANDAAELANVLVRTGRPDESVPLIRRAHEIYRARHGADDPRTLVVQANVASVLRRAGRLDEAEPVLRDVLERRRRVLGPEHEETLETAYKLALLCEMMGRFEAAEQLLRELIDIRSRTRGADDFDTLGTRYALGRVLRSAGRAADAEPILADVATRAGANAAIDPEQRASWIGEWGICLADLGRWDEAQPKLKQSWEMLGPDRTVQPLLRRWIAETFVRHHESVGDAEAVMKWRLELESLEPSTRPTSVPASQPAAG